MEINIQVNDSKQKLQMKVNLHKYFFTDVQKSFKAKSICAPVIKRDEKRDFDVEYLCVNVQGHCRMFQVGLPHLYRP